jgi:hypothetical protein
MGHNCIVDLPTGKDDAGDPLMWNAAHSCAPCDEGARSLDANIAVQRSAAANTAAWQSVSQFALL